MRRRVLAKALASERTLQCLLEGILVAQLKKGNLRGVQILNAALDAAVRRIERLAAAHRIDVQGERRPVLVAVNNMHIQAGG